jgi:hypothetical protein
MNADFLRYYEVRRSFPRAPKEKLPLLEHVKFRRVGRPDVNVEELLSKIAEVDQRRSSNYQTCADDKHNQHRLVEKARSRFNRRLNDMSRFLVHETAPQ